MGGTTLVQNQKGKNKPNENKEKTSKSDQSPVSDGLADENGKKLGWDQPSTTSGKTKSLLSARVCLRERVAKEGQKICHRTKLRGRGGEEKKEYKADWQYPPDSKKLNHIHKETNKPGTPRRSKREKEGGGGGVESCGPRTAPGDKKGGGGG